MAETLTRRDILTGAGRSAAPGRADPVHISSLVVQAVPERLVQVRDAIQRHGGEVAAEDARGKLVAVLECADSAAIANFADTLAAVPGVISANLVYHAIDEADPESTPGPSAA